MKINSIKSALLGSKTFFILSIFIFWLLELNNPHFGDSFGLFLFYFGVIPIVVGFIYGLILVLFLKAGGKAPKRYHIVLSAYILYIAGAITSILLYHEHSLIVSLLPSVIFIGLTIIFNSVLVHFYERAYEFFKGLKVSTKSVGIVIVLALMLIVFYGRVISIHNAINSGADKHKFLMLGFDGTSWQVINPLLEKGELPTISKIMKEGTYGNLRSLSSMFSPQVWNSIATGKTPDKHGIMDFFGESNDVLVKRIWEIMEEDGQSIGIFGYFSTYPPRPVNGFIVPGFMAPGPETYPMKYSFVRRIYQDFLGQKRGNLNRLDKARLKESEKAGVSQFITYGLQSIGYGLRLTTLDYLIKTLKSNATIGKDNSAYYAMNYKFRIAKLKFTSDIFAYMIMKEMPDFTVYYNKLPDNICHVYWRFYEPQYFKDVTPEQVAKYHDVIPEGYREMDRTIKKILGNIPPNTTVFILSDHGFQPSGHKLIVRGYSVMKRLGLDDKVRVWNVNDFCETIVLNPADADMIRNVLKSVKVNGNGENLFVINETEPNASKDHFTFKLKPDFDPKWLLKQKFIAQGDTLPLVRIIDWSQLRFSGVHRLQGVFMAEGPEIKANHEITGASVLDITPTILELEHKPTADDMDGVVLTDIFKSDFLSKFPVTYIPTYENGIKRAQKQKPSRTISAQQMEDLKALGYIQ